MSDNQDELSQITAVWDDYDNEDYRRDQSHWRGSADRWSDDRWEKIGEGTHARVLDLYRTAQMPMPDRKDLTVLEWGPGGGSNMFRFASLASKLYGVDISAKNLEETERVVSDVEGVEFVPLLLRDEPSSVVRHIDVPINLFISTAVFQHFPSQSYGARVLEAVHEVMAPRGLAYVQIRFDNGNPKYAPKALEDYQKSHITATSYELSAFWDLLVETGFRPLKIANLNTSINYAGFYFGKP